jgi:hypothetical protein
MKTKYFSVLPDFMRKFEDSNTSFIPDLSKYTAECYTILADMRIIWERFWKGTVNIRDGHDIVNSCECGIRGCWKHNSMEKRNIGSEKANIWEHRQKSVTNNPLHIVCECISNNNDIITTIVWRWIQSEYSKEGDWSGMGLLMKEGLGWRNLVMVISFCCFLHFPLNFKLSQDVPLICLLNSEHFSILGSHSTALRINATHIAAANLGMFVAKGACMYSRHTSDISRMLKPLMWWVYCIGKVSMWNLLPQGFFLAMIIVVFSF